MLSSSCQRTTLRWPRLSTCWPSGSFRQVLCGWPLSPHPTFKNEHVLIITMLINWKEGRTELLTHLCLLGFYL